MSGFRLPSIIEKTNSGTQRAKWEIVWVQSKGTEKQDVLRILSTQNSWVVQMTWLL